MPLEETPAACKELGATLLRCSPTTFWTRKRVHLDEALELPLDLCGCVQDNVVPNHLHRASSVSVKHFPSPTDALAQKKTKLLWVSLASILPSRDLLQRRFFGLSPHDGSVGSRPHGSVGFSGERKSDHRVPAAGMKFHRMRKQSKTGIWRLKFRLLEKKQTTP